jgi:predicted metal-dependent HD superfamily phosphohydrolase
MLHPTFTHLLSRYTDNPGLINELWVEIEKNYSGKKRHYHTLQHLEHLLGQLTEVKKDIQHWETVLFTLFYHDVVYNALKSDNEEKSAELAQKRMRQIAVPDETIERCTAQILATKSHVKSADSDTNFFTDADLSILGQPWETYWLYAQNVRKEYAIYPDLLYFPGRKKVLNHFLSMDSIFKTDYFYTAFEKQARANLRQELEMNLLMC